MIVYNVTVSIDELVHEEWLNWMKSKHIPDVMATGCFIESRISRVHGEEEGGKTFAITYISRTQEDFDNYREKYASALQQEHTEKYGGRSAAFRTMLTLLEEFKA